MADKEVNKDPKSTWGASPEYIKKWHEKFGKKDEENKVQAAEPKKAAEKKVAEKKEEPKAEVKPAAPAPKPVSEPKNDAQG